MRLSGSFPPVVACAAENTDEILELKYKAYETKQDCPASDDVEAGYLSPSSDNNKSALGV